MLNENLKRKVLAVSISKILLSSVVIVAISHSSNAIADCSNMSVIAEGGDRYTVNGSFSYTCVNIPDGDPLKVDMDGILADGSNSIVQELTTADRARPTGGHIDLIQVQDGSGVHASNGGMVTIKRDNAEGYTSLGITTTGSGDGIYSQGNGSSIAIEKDTTINSGGNGLVAEDNSTVSLSGKVDITAQSSALLLKNGATVAVGNNAQVSSLTTKSATDLIKLESGVLTEGTLTLSNGTLNSNNVAANVINADSGEWNVNLAKVSSNGDIITGSGATLLVSAESESSVTGDLSAAGGSTFTLNMAGSNLTGKASNEGTLNLSLNDSIWEMTGSSTVSSLNLQSGSRVNFASGNDKTLTTGALSGNGTFQINTKFNSDGSAQTDRIVVTGDAEGQHGLYVVAASGSKGGQTTSNGINVVQIDGTSTASFKLVNQSGGDISYISMDAYDYYLHEGTQEGNTSDENDWYLRSTYNGGKSDNGTPSAVDGPVQYRQEVPGYIITPYANMMYGYQTVGTLHERMGDTQQFARGYDNKTWGRFGGNHSESKAGRFNYDFDTMFAQFGRDLYQSVTEEDTSVTAGVTVTLGRQQTDARDKGRHYSGQSADTGSVTTNAYSIGGYYTRYANDGGYIDAVTQFTYYDNHYSSRYDADQKSYGLILSLEGGKPFGVTENWKIEPQGQIVYQFLNADDFNDEISDVRGDSYSGGLARAGVRFFRDAALDKENEVFKPYLTADVVGNLDDTPEVQVGSAKLRPDVDRVWWQTGVGITANAAKNTSFYLDAKYMQSFEGDLNGYAVHAGVQGRF
ncbi:autotransporter outer membrane beta-barrel domain-containing protein [Leminorella grimontii]|uniref:autotransporter family protein n=1 Tax=Leminorella grimontii TaxID=82981 RepID=UPI0032207CF1